jgi:hypothetical protein
MRQLCEQVALLDNGQPSSREIRLTIEVLIDTGRRPEEILRLPWDCLTHDTDGGAVLVYDNHKRDRRERRLPISQATAALITTQKERVHERFPDTPLAELVLLPTPHANPAGRKPISGGLLDLRHRDWVNQLPLMRLDEGAEFDKSKIVPYAYLHTYAQRHADAGVGIDVLAELLDHRNLDVPRRTTGSENSVAVTPSTRQRRAASTGTATGSGAMPTRCWTQNTPATRSQRSPSPTAGAPNPPTSEPAAAPAPSGSAAPAAITSGQTLRFCPTCRPTSMICCAPANASPPPSTVSMSGPAPMPHPPTRKSPGSGG